MRRRLAATVTVAAATAALLSGCFPNPLESLAENAGQDLVEGIIEEQTGAEIGTGGELPSDWPGLPVPEGEIAASFVATGIYNLTIITADEATIEDTIAELEASGFTKTTSGDLGGFKSAVLEGAEWTVTFAWGADESSGGFALNYSAAPAAS